MKTVEARQGFCPLVRHKVAPEQGTIPPPLLHKPGPVTAGVLGGSAQTDSHCETASGSGEDTERSPPVARPVIQRWVEFTFTAKFGPINSCVHVENDSRGKGSLTTVSLRGVTKTFEGRKGQRTEVLKGIDVDVRSGEFLAILGASGCGKSTLLRLISGLELVTEGTVTINDTDVTADPPAKRQLAMVFQNYALFPHLDVRGNILFGLRSRRVAKQTQRERLSETARLLGLGDLLGRKPSELSGGQRQRVALGRALVSGQQLVLMDEPLSNLDAKLRAEMRTEIKRIQRALDLTIIYVTHDQVEAMTMADRVLMMVDGRIEQLAAPDELYRAPATTTVARFIGSPPMNIINFDSDSELSSLAPSPLRDHGGALGVRPERLRLLPIATASVAGHEIELGNATILVNELLGADRIIAAELSGSGKVTGQHVVARVAPEFALDMDDQVVVVTEREAIHWYAPDTGRRVEPTTDQHIEPGTRRPVAQQTTTVPQPSA